MSRPRKKSVRAIENQSEELWLKLAEMLRQANYACDFERAVNLSARMRRVEEATKRLKGDICSSSKYKRAMRKAGVCLSSGNIDGAANILVRVTG